MTYRFQVGKWRLEISWGICPEGYFAPSNGVKNKWQLIVLLQTGPRRKKNVEGQSNVVDMGPTWTNTEPDRAGSSGSAGNNRSIFQ